MLTPDEVEPAKRSVNEVKKKIEKAESWDAKAYLMNKVDVTTSAQNLGWPGMYTEPGNWYGQRRALSEYLQDRGGANSLKEGGREECGAHGKSYYSALNTQAQKEVPSITHRLSQQRGIKSRGDTPCAVPGRVVGKAAEQTKPANPHIHRKNNDGLRVASSLAGVLRPTHTDVRGDPPTISRAHP
eukprot:5375159-Pleurochrysis_carterae.AAC.2